MMGLSDRADEHIRLEKIRKQNEKEHAEYVAARLEGRTRTLRDIRDHEGWRKQREADVYPGHPHRSEKNEVWLLLSSESRFRRVVRALDAAGYPPSVKNVVICCRKAPLDEVRHSGGWTLNGRECAWRRKELARLGYVSNADTGWRWKKP